MPKIRMRTPSPPSVHTKRYSSFRGVDFSSDPSQVDERRSPWAVNVYADESGCLRKRPGWRKLAAVDPPVRGIYRYETRWVNGLFIVHAGGKLYSWKGGEDAPTVLMSGLSGESSHGFMHKGRLFILTGKEYVCVKSDADEETLYECDLQGGAGSPRHIAELRKKTSEMTDAGMVQKKVFIWNDSNLVNAFEEDVTQRTITSPVLSAEKVERLAYAPVTSYNRTVTSTAASTGPSGELPETEKGEAFEALNMASSSCRNSFKVDVAGMYESTDINNYYFLLDRRMPMATTIDDIKLTTAEGNKLRAEGIIWFAAIASNAVHYGVTTLAEAYDPRYPEASLRYLHINEVALYQALKAIGDTSTVINVEFPVGGTEKELEELEKRRSRVSECKTAGWYSSRLFIAGNDEYPNADWYSEVNEPTYFPEINYTEIGTDDSRILGYLPIGEQQAVIKSTGLQTQDASVYLRRAEWDDAVAGGYFFPIKRGATGTGAVSFKAFSSLVDDALFLSSSGVMGLVADNITGERVLAQRSTYVNSKLLREDLSAASCCVWNGFLLIAVGGNVYLADSRARNYARNTAGNFEYEWHYWQELPATCMCAAESALLFGTADGKLCRLNDDLDEPEKYADYPDGLSGTAKAIVAEWSTKFDDDGDFMIKKNMTRRGCGVFLMGSRRGNVKLLVRTDRDFERVLAYRRRGVFDFNDIDFENFTFETLPRLVAAINRKVKKYSAIQVICRSDDVGHDFGILGIERRFVTGYFNK